MDLMPELGCYALAGAPATPRVLLDEVREAERLGLGAVFLSERFNIKEAVTLSGAAAGVSERIGIATAATNQNTRHPIVTASFATTMHRLTGGRFALGLGRGINMIFDMMGIPRNSTAAIEDFAGLMRRLWRGEMIFGHDGPAGRFQMLHLDQTFQEDIPLLLAAFAPPSLRLAGRAFDAVVLHTFLTDETTARSVRIVRESAEKTGRDPRAVRVWSCFATIGDHIPHPLRLKKTVGRLATYLQGYGPLLVKTNRWDASVLERFWSDPVVGEFRGAIDDKATTEQLEHIATLLPPDWLAPAAMGSPDQCVDAILNQFALGVDGVILHGATPTELAPIVEAYRRRRPAGRFDHLDPNPGRVRLGS